MLQKSTQFQTQKFSKQKLFTPNPYKILQKHLTEVAATPVVAWGKKCIEGRRENGRTCPRIVGKLLIFFLYHPPINTLYESCDSASSVTG